MQVFYSLLKRAHSTLKVLNVMHFLSFFIFKTICNMRVDTRVKTWHELVQESFLSANITAFACCLVVRPMTVLFVYSTPYGCTLICCVRFSVFCKVYKNELVWSERIFNIVDAPFLQWLRTFLCFRLFVWLRRLLYLVREWLGLWNLLLLAPKIWNFIFCTFTYWALMVVADSLLGPKRTLTF